MCLGCGNVKALSEFSPCKLGKLGRRSKCKACEAERVKRPKHARLPFGELPKRCAKCRKTKPPEDFAKSKYAKQGITSRCKACIAEGRRKNPEKRQAQRHKAAAKKGRRYQTAEERAAAMAERRRAIAAAKKAWRWYLDEGASDQWVAAYWEGKGYPLLNPRIPKAERRQRRLIYERLRARHKKLRRQGRLQWCMTRALKDNGTSPTVEREIGYTILELRQHLERLFTKGMTWEKFAAGEIHIDHRVPTTAFDLSNPDEVRACFALTNLQPLWAVDNIKKGARRDLLL